MEKNIEDNFYKLYNTFDDDKRQLYRRLVEYVENMLDNEIKNDDIVSTIRFILDMNDTTATGQSARTQLDMYTRITKGVTRQKICNTIDNDICKCIWYIIYSWCDEKLSYFEQRIPSIDDLK
jgi:hypothetical protein